MTIALITDTVRTLQKKYDETDPLRLTAAMHVLVRRSPMGLYDGCCKGFFITACRQKHITVNGDLPEPLQKVVLAHELGHCVLHASRIPGAAFHDMSLFDSTDRLEYEANIFAAQLLLSDAQVLSLIQEDISFFDIARQLCVPFELLDFKLRILQKEGCPLKAPVVSQGDFLKHVEQTARTPVLHQPE